MGDAPIAEGAGQLQGSAQGSGPASEAGDAEGTRQIPLLQLREPRRPVVADDAALDEAVAQLGAATGPVAIDAERASGYRYSGRAYLVQIRREGAGTFLIDPIDITDM